MRYQDTVGSAVRYWDRDKSAGGCGTRRASGPSQNAASAAPHTAHAGGTSHYGVYYHDLTRTARRQQDQHRMSTVGRGLRLGWPAKSSYGFQLSVTSFASTWAKGWTSAWNPRRFWSISLSGVTARRNPGERFQRDLGLGLARHVPPDAAVRRSPAQRRSGRRRRSCRRRMEDGRRARPGAMNSLINFSVPPPLGVDAPALACGVAGPHETDDAATPQAATRVRRDQRARPLVVDWSTMTTRSIPRWPTADQAEIDLAR